MEAVSGYEASVLAWLEKYPEAADRRQVAESLEGTAREIAFQLIDEGAATS